MKKVSSAFLAVVLSAPILAQAAPAFQGFETDTGDWVLNLGASGRVASGGGSLGVASASGGFHAELHNQQDAYQAGYGSAGYSFFGGADPTYAGSFYQSIAVYIDPTWAAGNGFWVDMSPRGTDNSSLFAAEGNFRLTGNGTGVDVQAINGSNLATITTAGWHTFRMEWSKGANPTDLIQLTLKLLDSTDTLLGSEAFAATFPASGNPIGESQNLGNNGYVWLTVWENGFAGDVIAVDNVQTGLLAASVPEPSSLALFACALGAVIGHPAQARLQRA